MHARAPGMGKNFRDHYFVRLSARLKDGVISLNQMAKGWRLGLEIAKWASGIPSILSLSPSIVHAFWKSSERPGSSGSSIRLYSRQL